MQNQQKLHTILHTHFHNPFNVLNLWEFSGRLKNYQPTFTPTTGVQIPLGTPNDFNRLAHFLSSPVLICTNFRVLLFWRCVFRTQPS